MNDDAVPEEGAAIQVTNEDVLQVLRTMRSRRTKALTVSPWKVSGDKGNS